jgi:hypothetical protein
MHSVAPGAPVCFSRLVEIKLLCKSVGDAVGGDGGHGIDDGAGRYCRGPPRAIRSLFQVGVCSARRRLAPEKPARSWLRVPSRSGAILPPGATARPTSLRRHRRIEAKRRLIKGPGEFRDALGDQPKKG